MRQPKVLMTGFEPFGKFKINPTQVLMERFRKGRPGIQLTKLVLPVTSGAFKAMQQRTGGRHFDIVLHFGLAVKTKAIRLETRAWNMMNFYIPDNRGRKIKNKAIAPSGPEYLYSNLPIDALVKALKRAGERTIVSDSAGGFVCNLLLYRSLERSMRDPARDITGFIHVPLQEVLSLERLVGAVNIILDVCSKEFEARNEP